MPNIKQYDAGDVGFQLSDRGANAFREAAGVATRAGRQAEAEIRHGAAALIGGATQLAGSLGDLYTQAQNHDDTLAQTQAAQKSADFDLDQHRKLDDIMKPRQDPSDPTGQRQVQPNINDAPGMIGQRLDDWKQERDAVRETITNPKALTKWDKDTATSYKAYANKAYAIGGDLAYHAAGDNLVKAVQSNAGVVYSDPSQLDTQLGKLHSQINEVTGSMNLTADKAAKFQTEFEQKSARSLIENAVEGAARKGEEGRKWATDLVNSGKYDNYIGTDKDKLLNHIRTVDRNERADISAQRTVQQQQQKDQGLARTDQYIVDAASGNPQMKLNDIWHDPAYTNRPDLRKEAIGVVETMRKFNSQDLNVSPMVSNQTSHDLLSRMVLADGDPNKVTDRRTIDQAFIDHSLSKQDYTFLLNQQKAMGSPAEKELAGDRKSFFERFQGTIDPVKSATGQPSALGNQNMYKAQQDAIKREAQLRAEGKDPRSLYDPSSPNFFGNPQNLTQYHTSLEAQRTFQTENEKALKDTIQKYAPGSTALSNPNTAPGGTPVQIASQYLGAHENRDHATLTAFLNQAGGPKMDPATTAWCARFMNATLAASGQAGSNSDAARSFLNVGMRVDPTQAKAGDIIVFPRGSNPAQGHVGFIKSIDGDRVQVLAGNQGNAVSVKEFNMSQALGIRRVGPNSVGQPIPGAQGTVMGSSNLFGGEPSATAKIPQSIMDVKTPAEASALPGGTRIRLPDGRIGTVPYPQVPQSR
jgi:uncharacterized protein (TIGR02594 family)